jgi:hypothetical protein
MNIDAFDNDFVKLWIDALDGTLLSFVGAGDDNDFIAFFDVHVFFSL